MIIMKRKGISPLISATLLIAMSVTISLLVGGWASQFVRQKTQQISEKTTTQLDCSFANLYIKSFTFDCNSNCGAGTQHNVTVEVSNIGQKDISIEKIVILNTTGGILTLTLEDSNGNSPANLSSGDIKSLTNSSTLSCIGFNSSTKIEKVYISDISCPDARDEYDPVSSDFVNC